jgi:DNA transposition AAA+ family ATPase
LQAAMREHSAGAVETSVVRFIRTRFEVTHEERAICVIAGPWGIGKTTAVNWFASKKTGNCAVVKVEQGSQRRGASPIFALQLAVEAIRPLIGRTPRAALSNACWSLRRMLYDHLEEWRSQRQPADGIHDAPRFTFVFDEAQYLSRDAIEMLRYWNDVDRTVSPFPIGLIFVGNSEFALEAGTAGDSVLTGAVRSRALFLETLEYDDVDNGDIQAFLLS